jgi:hypothetical protein
VIKPKSYGETINKKGTRKEFAQAVDVTPQMSAHLITVLRETRPSVTVVVAPYDQAQALMMKALGH